MTPAVLELLLTDTLRRWKRTASTSSANPISRLAAALGEAFEWGDLEVTWQTGSERITGRWPSIEDGDLGPSLSQPTSYVEALAIEPYTLETAIESAPHAWIRFEDPAEMGCLTLAAPWPSTQAKATWLWLSTYLRGLIDIYIDVKYGLAREALHAARAQAASTLLRATQQARDSKETLAERVSQTASAFEAIQRVDLGDLVHARALLAWTLQEAITHRLILRTPWPSALPSRADPAQRNLPDAFEGACRVFQSLERTAAPHDYAEPHDDYIWRVACLRTVAEATVSAPATGSNALHHALPIWLWAWRVSLDPNAEPEIRDQAWTAATACLHAAIVTITKRKTPWWGATSSRTWLLLWLVGRIVARMAHKPTPTPAQLLFPEIDLRAHVAHVVCEALRHEWLGTEPDYTFLARPYAEALRVLVEYHAHVVLGVPLEFELRHALLVLTHEAAGVRGTASAGQLLHVLDVYIAGQFLLDLRVEPAVQAGDGRARPRASPVAFPSLADRIVGRDAGSPTGTGTARASECRQAYAVAAVYHDIGHLLFTPDQGPDGDLHRADPELAADVAHAVGSRRELAKRWARRAADAVGVPSIVSTVDDAGVAEWLRQPPAEHGLLGAYYLARVTRELPPEHDELRRQAVRAVLLHASAPVPVRVARDPVAAVLLLCNELFDWDAARAPVIPQASVSRSFHVIGADIPAYEPRHRRLCLKRMRLSGAAPDQGWVLARMRGDLHVRMDLQPPERIDVTTYAVWLTKAVRLARLEPDRALTWAPTLEVRSQIRSDLQSLGLDTHTLLQRLTPDLPPPFRAELARWLMAQPRRVRGHDEMLTIRAGTPFGHDVQPHLAEIDHLAQRLVERELHRLSVHRSGEASGSARQRRQTKPRAKSTARSRSRRPPSREPSST